MRDLRTDREILLSIERLLQKLVEEKAMTDIFSRIAAALVAMAAGDTSALGEHVAAIDSHLSTVDTEVLGLQTDDTSSQARLTAIETGLGKIADAVDTSASNPGGTNTADGGVTGSGTTAPPSGDGTAPATNPGGAADAGAASGVTAGVPQGSDTPSSDAGGTAEASPAPTQQTTTTTTTGNPGESAPIPASGPGSETTGQVDTPVTSQ